MNDIRHPPQSVEAEQSVIGGLLIRNEAFPLLSDWLTPEDFYRRDHRLIFAHSGDNLGPPAFQEVIGQYLALSQRYPGAMLQASTIS